MRLVIQKRQKIIFDEEKISYADLVEIYWAQTDPTDAFGQFEDRGDNYRPVIFYSDERQRQIAEQSKVALQASGRFKEPIVTAIEPVQPLLFGRRLPSRFLQEKS